MIQIPSANEIRRQVQEDMNKECESVLQRCVEGIQMSARTKQTSTTFGLTRVSSGVRQFIQTKLENAGYKVEYISDQRDGDYLNISWA
jgi:F420-0:gamma-glutamyl ligase